MIYEDIPSAISLPELADGQLPLDLQGGQTTSLHGQEAVPASPSPQRDGKKAKQMSAICGQCGSALSVNPAQALCLESRCQPLSVTVGGMTWPMIWKEKVTPRGRKLGQLVVLVNHTSETDCGLWATPNTMDTLPQRSQEAKDRQFSTTRKGRTAPANLREQVHPAMWPTPSAGDDRDRGRWENPCIQRRITNGKQVNLSMIAQASNGSNAQTGNQGQLNPEFVSWLMGYSTAHLSSMHSAMQSFQMLRRRSSKIVERDA